MIGFRCPECGEAFGVPEATAGQSQTCPKCGNVTTVPLPTAVPMVTAPQADVHYEPVVKRSTGLAVAALVLGLCGFVPVLGAVPALLGIILGIVVLAGRRPGRGLAIGGVATGAISLLLLQLLLIPRILLPNLQSAPAPVRRAACQSNLQSIGWAVQVYMNSNDDMGPADLQALVDGDYLGWESLDCPGEPTLGNVDYFYFRPPADASAESLMACDLKGNHPGDGRNVLLLDGTVKWLNEADFRKLLAQPQNAAFAKALAEVEGP